MTILSPEGRDQVVAWGEPVIEAITWQSFEAVRLASGRFSITFVPQLGAKVVSLVDTRVGHEWLAQTNRGIMQVPEPGRPWADFDRSGWDECFPSIGGGTHPDPHWADLVLEDHGELWSRPWRCAVSGNSVECAVDGGAFPYLFRRSLQIEDDRLRIDYEVTNQSERDFACMWAMHPLLAAKPGTRITGLNGTFRVDGAAGQPVEPGAHVQWPTLDLGDGRSLDLSEAPAGPGGVAVKLFAPWPRAGVSVTSATSRLTFRVHPDVGYLGLWLNYDGWPPGPEPLRHVAIEPSTGNQDDLGSIVQTGNVMVLRPGQSRRWWVELQLDDDASAAAAPPVGEYGGIGATRPDRGV